MAFGVCPAFGDPIPAAKITEFGIFRMETIKAEMAPGENKVLVNKTTDPQHVRRVKELTPRLGLRFGYQFQMEAPLKDPITRFTMVTKHPPMQQPGQAELKTKTVSQCDVKGGTGYIGYCFDDPWEMVPGEWNLAVHLGDKELCNMTFTVLPPKDD